MQHFAANIMLVTQSVKSSLLAAFRHLLKPLVRLATKNGISLREFSQVIQESYVDATRKQIVASGDLATREAVASMLNVGLRDVDAVLSNAQSTRFIYEDDQSSPVSRVLAGWFTDPRSIGPYGVLVDLPFGQTSGFEQGARFSFSDLAHKYCPGTKAQALLEEAMKTGCVASVGGGFYRAVKRSYVPAPLSAVSVSHFAHVVHNICENFETNLRIESSGGNGLFERTIVSDTRITREDLKAFDKYIRIRGQLFADDVDNWLSSRTPPLPSDVDSLNTGIGLYHFVVNDEDEREFSQNPKLEVKR